MSSAAVNWLKIAGPFFILVGVCLFFLPSYILQLLTKVQGDGVQWHLGRCIGAQMLAMGYTIWQLGKSKNAETATTCLSAIIVKDVLFIMMTLHASTHYQQDFQHISLLVTLFISASCLCATAWYLVKSHVPVGQRLNSQQIVSNSLVQLDAVVALFIGVAWICFPDWILQRQVSVTLNGGHIYLGRLMGALFVCTQTMSSQSLYWSESIDRHTWMIGRVLMCLGILTAQIWSQVAYHHWWTGKHWVGITLFSTWTAVTAWFAYNVRQKKFD